MKMHMKRESRAEKWRQKLGKSPFRVACRGKRASRGR